jgi:hypothetical protein
MESERRRGRLCGGDYFTSRAEVLVHFSVLPRGFVLTEIHIPAAVAIESIDIGHLPAAWRALSPSASTQEIGRRWGFGRPCCRSHRQSCRRSGIMFSIPASRLWTDQVFDSTPFRFDARLK